MRGNAQVPHKASELFALLKCFERSRLNHETVAILFANVRAPPLYLNPEISLEANYQTETSSLAERRLSRFFNQRLAVYSSAIHVFSIHEKSFEPCSECTATR